MTGELTLTGQVLAIGGLREKVLAAQRAGLKRIVLPRENESDLDDLPAETKRELEFVLVDSIEQVLEVAFARRRGRRYGVDRSCSRGRGKGALVKVE